MRYPALTPLRTSRLLTNTFPGYVHKQIASDGTFFDTTNLSTDKYPLISTRKKRGTVQALTAPGGLIEKNVLGYVDNGTLYYNFLPTPVTGLSAGEKQLVSMGAYICIFPDKVYFNTENHADYGSMEASYQSSGDIVFSLCRADGTDYQNVVVSDDEPENHTSVEVWISTAGETAVAMSWSSITAAWVELGTVYTKLTFTTQGQIPRLFAEGDGVTISGADFDDANGEKILYAVGGSGDAGQEESDWVVLVGLLENGFVQETGSVTITRTVPTLDFVCQCQNRLWGCFYGVSGGVILNEIYCCALGDFKNWRQYRGESTDSWAASVGSDGQWTGAANFLGNPVFFKENCMHQVLVSSSGAHQVQETVCRGVQKGSSKSVVVVNETLFYKSRNDVCIWQGSFPTEISAALGESRYYDASAGTFAGKYYISMHDEDGAWNLFVYDIAKQLWIREDNLHVLQFATVDDELYAVDADTNDLLALNGTVGTTEETLNWEAVTGVLTYEYPDRKYLSRFNIRLRMAPGGEAQVFLQYNDDGTWQSGGSVSARRDYGSVVLPIRPRRCDYLKMKIVGTGETEILSISRVLEIGSDMR